MTETTNARTDLVESITREVLAALGAGGAGAMKPGDLCLTCTGACASLVAASLKGLADRRADVSLPGGVLRVEWLDGRVVLTGPARHMFDGKTVD